MPEALLLPGFGGATRMVPQDEPPRDAGPPTSGSPSLSGEPARGGAAIRWAGLRDYQVEACEAIAAELLAHRSTMLVMATGLGKTITAAAFVHQWKADHPLWPDSVLWLAHRDELLSQARDQIERLTGELVSLEQADFRGGGTRIMVASVQTLKGKRLAAWARDRFSLIVVDECFPAGTLVDGRPIETIRVGDRVRCIDHSTGQLATGIVARCFRKRSSNLIRLTCGATAITCTDNHPIFVKERGYVAAGKIRKGDLLCLLSDVRGSTVGSEATTEDLQKTDVQEQAFVSHRGGNQQSSRFSENAGKQSDASRGRSRENDSHLASHGMEAAGPWRQWNRGNGGGAGDRESARMEDASGRADQNAARLGISDLLQTRRSARDSESRDRSGRNESLHYQAQGAGPQEGGFLAWARVDCIASVEPSGPDGDLVYDLEIAGSHTYFAAGILVHNCHHAPSQSYRKILDHFETAKVVGLTATPDRLDGKAQGDVFETVAIKRDIDFGIAEGFLVPMVLEATYIESIDVGRAKTVMGDLDESTVEEEIVKAVAPIAKAVREATPTGERSLTFTPRVASAHGVSEALNAHTIESSRCVDGKTERQLRKAILRDHKRGRFAHLLNCQVFTEGYDDPGVRIGCIARLTKSRALYVQMLGRLLRPLPGIGELPTRGERLAAIAASAKPHAIIVDITGHAGKHRLISPVDILGGRYTEDERARAKKNLTKEAGEVGKALAQARDELRAEEKAKAEATARRAAAAQIKLRRKIIDPWAVLGREDPIGEPGAPGGTTPADGYQLRWLEQAGVDIPQGCTTSQAAALMRAVTHRRAAGLCTYKQARTLGRQGFDTSKMRKDTASALVQALFDHKWHPPRALVDDILNRAREPGEEG